MGIKFSNQENEKVKNSDSNTLGNRSKYYQLGRQRKEEGKFIEAIEAYIEYSTFLSEEDQHIPFKWIGEIYDLLGNQIESIKSKIEYAKGCSFSLSIEIYRELQIQCNDLNNDKLFNEILDLKKIALANQKLNIKRKN